MTTTNFLIIHLIFVILYISDTCDYWLRFFKEQNLLVTFQLKKQNWRIFFVFLSLYLFSLEDKGEKPEKGKRKKSCWLSSKANTAKKREEFLLLILFCSLFFSQKFLKKPTENYREKERRRWRWRLRTMGL